MSEMIILALIANIPSIVGALAAVAAAYLSYRAVVASKQIQKQTDGMKTELVEEVRKASFARGKKSQKDNPEQTV